MDLRHLKTLIAIAEQRSFAAVGDVVGLTQSAVSLHVKAIEEQLGARLFDRSTRPPLLDARGKALVERAREIVRLCDDLTDSVGGEAIRGRLDLGVVPTVLTGVLPQALVSLRKAHPDLRFGVTSGLSAELAGGVRRSNLDVAVVSEPAELAAGISWHACGREPLMIIAPKGTRGGTDKTLLETLPFIRFTRLAWAGGIIDAHLRDRGIRVRPDMEIDTLEGVAAMVCSGLGVSVVPKRPVDRVFPGKVRAVPFGEPPLYRSVGLIERTANPKASLVKTLNVELLKLYGSPD